MRAQHRCLLAGVRDAGSRGITFSHVTSNLAEDQARVVAAETEAII